MFSPRTIVEQTLGTDLYKETIFSGSETYEAFWMAFTDEDSEGKWKDVYTGENIIHSNFGVGQLNGGSGQNCMLAEEDFSWSRSLRLFVKFRKIHFFV